jgi:aminobenzoyl-glutamate transport protein
VRRFSPLAFIERVGNRLPDPASLFVIGCALVLIGSAAAALSGWSVPHPSRPGETVTAVNLLSSAEQRWIWLNVIKNFLDFHPLGVVLVAMLGIGVAERTGLFAAILKLIVLATPSKLLTPAVVFAGVMSSAAADAGYVVLPPLVAGVYAAVGRAPLAGLAAVTFGIAGGFSANLLITSLDPLLQGITLAAAHLVRPDLAIRVDCNWYFMIASTFLLTGMGWAVTAWVVEPRFDRATVARHIGQAGIDASATRSLDRQERRGLLAAGLVAAITFGTILALVQIPGAPLYGDYEKAPGRIAPVWTDALVPILFVGFLLPGIAYGIVAGNVRSDRDIAKRMGESMASMGTYVVLAFFAGQFIKWFDRSNLGLMIAVEGVDALKGFGLSPVVLTISIVSLTALINLFMSSASAKWAILAPVMVPLFMGLGLSPELVQAAYRVGDSVTNPITPLNAYLVVILVVIRRYEPAAGVGTVISLLLPYTLTAWVVWLAFLLAWGSIGLPLGPGGPAPFAPLAP